MCIKWKSTYLQSDNNSVLNEQLGILMLQRLQLCLKYFMTSTFLKIMYKVLIMYINVKKNWFIHALTAHDTSKTATRESNLTKS